MAKAKEKPGVMVYWETFDVLESLVDGDAKQMLAAIRQYSQYGVLPDFTGNAILTTLWLLIRPKLDADSERYERIREQKREAGLASAAKRANERQRALADVDERQRIQPTTTATATASPTASPTTPPTATASPTTSTASEQGLRDNEERDKGVTCHTAPVPADNPDANFEKLRQEQIAKLEQLSNGGMMHGV